MTSKKMFLGGCANTIAFQKLASAIVCISTVFLIASKRKTLRLNLVTRKLKLNKKKHTHTKSNQKINKQISATQKWRMQESDK